ncbi:MAG: glutathione transferase [Thauera phenolivorans]|uniref:Glutathione transferase n=1 Tax=Thauera phenolivorans TaxID=1792543 RepID=A0A7X7LUI1_9RHOO|nr:glutathione transferase [Thauera phenolivorans]NLF53469.1 glutathione transferase [Thauera phenolivorans]
MPDSDLLLYVDARFLSPYAMSVFVGLEEKSLPFRLETVDLEGGAQHAPAYAALSLTGRVPTLVHAGFALSESSAITEYLDDVFGGVRLYPAEPRARARARQLQAWLRSDLDALKAERSTEGVFRAPVAVPLSAQAHAAAARLFRVAEALLPAGEAHLFGVWSVADVDLALALQRLLANGDEVPARLADYARGEWERPAVRQWIARARETA